MEFFDFIPTQWKAGACLRTPVGFLGESLNSAKDDIYFYVRLIAGRIIIEYCIRLRVVDCMYVGLQCCRCNAADHVPVSSWSKFLLGTIIIYCALKAGTHTTRKPRSAAVLWV